MIFIELLSLHPVAGRKVSTKKLEIIWRFFRKAGPTYARERPDMGFPLIVGSRRENVPGVLDCGFVCSSLLSPVPFRATEAGKLKPHFLTPREARVLPM